jgi:hypothetical protein
VTEKTWSMSTIKINVERVIKNSHTEWCHLAIRKLLSILFLPVTVADSKQGLRTQPQTLYTPSWGHLGQMTQGTGGSAVGWGPVSQQLFIVLGISRSISY